MNDVGAVPNSLTYAWGCRNEYADASRFLAAMDTVAWTAGLPFPDFAPDYEYVALRHPFSETVH